MLTDLQALLQGINTNAYYHKPYRGGKTRNFTLDFCLNCDSIKLVSGRIPTIRNSCFCCKPFETEIIERQPNELGIPYFYTDNIMYDLGILLAIKAKRNSKGYMYNGIKVSPESICNALTLKNDLDLYWGRKEETKK